VTFDFVECFAVDEWPHCHAVFHAVTDFECVDSCGQLFCKRICYALLHIHTVGTHAGLPGSAKFVGHQLIDRSIHISIVKHDERCVAAEFQGQSFQVRCGVGDEFLADRCGACEADDSHGWVFAQYVTDFSRRAKNQIRFAGRQSDLFNQRK